MNTDRAVEACRDKIRKAKEQNELLQLAMDLRDAIKDSKNMLQMREMEGEEDKHWVAQGWSDGWFFL